MSNSLIVNLNMVVVAVAQCLGSVRSYLRTAEDTAVETPDSQLPWNPASDHSEPIFSISCLLSTAWEP